MLLFLWIVISVVYSAGTVSADVWSPQGLERVSRPDESPFVGGFVTLKFQTLFVANEQSSTWPYIARITRVGLLLAPYPTSSVVENHFKLDNFRLAAMLTDLQEFNWNVFSLDDGSESRVTNFFGHFDVALHIESLNVETPLSRNIVWFTLDTPILWPHIAASHIFNGSSNLVLEISYDCRNVSDCIQPNAGLAWYINDSTHLRRQSVMTAQEEASFMSTYPFSNWTTTMIYDFAPHVFFDFEECHCEIFNDTFAHAIFRAARIGDDHISGECWPGFYPLVEVDSFGYVRSVRPYVACVLDSVRGVFTSPSVICQQGHEALKPSRMSFIESSNNRSYDDNIVGHFGEGEENDVQEDDRVLLGLVLAIILVIFSILCIIFLGVVLWRRDNNQRIHRLSERTHGNPATIKSRLSTLDIRRRDGNDIQTNITSDKNNNDNETEVTAETDNISFVEESLKKNDSNSDWVHRSQIMTATLVEKVLSINIDEEKPPEDCHEINEPDGNSSQIQMVLNMENDSDSVFNLLAEADSIEIEDAEISTKGTSELVHKSKSNTRIYLSESNLGRGFIVRGEKRHKSMSSMNEVTALVTAAAKEDEDIPLSLANLTQLDEHTNDDMLYEHRISTHEHFMDESISSANRNDIINPICEHRERQLSLTGVSAIVDAVIREEEEHDTMLSLANLARPESVSSSENINEATTLKNSTSELYNGRNNRCASLTEVATAISTSPTYIKGDKLLSITNLTAYDDDDDNDDDDD